LVVGGSPNIRGHNCSIRWRRFGGPAWTGATVVRSIRRRFDRVEVPIRRWAWESHHTELTQIGGITVPVPALCERLGLVSHNGSLDFRYPKGGVATLYREWPKENGGLWRSHLLYIREELIRQYLEETQQRMVWVPWGERTLHHDVLNATDDPPQFRRPA
jgi:hypothetical protein